MAWNGKCLTANITCPKIVKECSLSDILEESVDEKYYLSQHTIDRLMSYKDSDIKDTTDGVVSNTLAHGDRESVGVYPTSSGGVLQVNGYHKG